MVFNKKRAANEKKLIEKMALEQEHTLKWLEIFLHNYPLKLSLPSIKLSYELREKQFGNYALANIEQTNLLTLAKFQNGEITQDELTLKQAELAEKKQRLVIREPMHASYIANTHTIVYYIENIKNTASEKDYSLEEFFSRIIVHEMFHAAHCFLCGTKHWSDQNCPREWSTTVKESLARYVEYVFSMENNFTVHEEAIKNDLLDPHKCAPSYPYAGAKKLILDKKADFKEVLKLSLEDWQKAYRQIK